MAMTDAERYQKYVAAHPGAATERYRRWRKKNPARANEIERRYRAQVQPGDHHYQPWTTEEMERITADDRPNDIVLARELGRTLAAVHAKRVAIRKSEEQEADRA